jgi:uncharacterized protein YjbI with pentapeptide repeats
MAKIARRIASFWREMLSLLLVLIAGLVLWLVPTWEVTRWPDIAPKDQFASVNEARRTIATILGGLVVFVGAYFTWRNLNIAKEDQTTDRFTKAIEQLGAGENDKPQIEVRLGGIYALARMARQYQSDWPIIEVFCAYVRQNSPYSSISGESSENPATTIKSKADIEAILAFLSTYDYPKKQVLNLSRTNLQNLNLPKARLPRVDFSYSNLSGANLREAELNDANLQGANLSSTVLESAKLRKARLNSALLEATHMGWADLNDSDLSDAKLRSTRLSGARLQRAQLIDAELDHASLGGADLSNANLSGAILEEVNLGKAKLNNAQLVGARIGSNVRFTASDLTDADLSDLDMRLARDLTEKQLQVAKGTSQTTLPRPMKNPDSWPSTERR